jgi:hypothetical protein
MNQRGLSAAGLLEVVDAGADGNAAVRGSVLAAAAAPEVAGERIQELTLGDRDGRILGLRCATFGDTLCGRVTCPACGSALTVRIPRDEVSRGETVNESERPASVRIEEGSFVVEARSPDGRILAAAAACEGEDEARRALIRGCVTVSGADGGDLDPLGLEDELLERVGEAIVELDPQAEVGVTMGCAGCGNEWTPILDIAQFFWRELSATSVQLLDEVHQLAIGYGWSEEQVLRLSSRRRREYVERLVGD